MQISIPSIITRLSKTPYVKAFSTFFVFDAINKALPFILLPIIARFLTTSEFGIVSNYLTLYQIAYIVISFSTYTKLSTDYFKKGFDLMSSFTNLINLMAGNLLVFLLFVTIFSHWISQTLHFSIIWQLLAVFTAFFASVGNLFTTMLIMRQKSMTYGIVQNFNSLLLFVFTLLLIAVVPLNWKGRIIAQVISSFFLFLFTIFVSKYKYKIFKFSINKNIITEYFKWGLPLLPHTLSYWLKGGIDKIIVTKFLGLAINGIFSLSMTLGSVMSLITTSFFNVYSPFVYKQLAKVSEFSTQEDYRIIRKLRRNCIVFILCYGILSILSYYALKILIDYFFTGDYLIAVKYLPLVLLTNFIYAIYTIFSSFLFYNGKNKYIASTTIVSAVIQVVLNIVLINYIGIKGVLIANVVASAYVAFMIVRGAINQYPMLLSSKNVE